MKDNIKVKGHGGTWYIIDTLYMFGKTYYLLEHETFGEDTCHVAIDDEQNLILDGITNGLDDLIEYLETEVFPNE